MIEYKKIDGGDLGDIFLRRNPRARNYSLRVDKGQLYATMPKYGSLREMLRFIDEQRPRLQNMLKANPCRPFLDERSDFKTPVFAVKISQSTLNGFYRKYKDGVLTILYPIDANIKNEHVQTLFWKVIENTLRDEAKKKLPQRLAELALRHGFSYTEVKINNSRTHWGSCTAQKHINLSLSLMLLPNHLIDYVLLHELCHTIEMNHSIRFWNLMDKTTNGMAASYKKELKLYKML